ncbi:MAG TPA: hypothetical protein VK206_01950 [Anaerolineales bacterium]|nr:hypothetical protein [Anaerolineales bacterium]
MNSRNDWKMFLGFALRVIIAHTLTYFVFGIVMSNVFNYAEVFKQAVIRDYMLPMDQHNVLIGPFMQPIRGLIFAIGLWPIRSFLIEKKRGWLTLWGLLVTIGILSTPAASPGSIEGMLYSKLPIWYHWIGYPEIMLQTLAFSIWLIWWEHQSVRRHEMVIKNENPLIAEIVKAIMTACFAYIGYAIGGLILAFNANAKATATGTSSIDIEAAGADFKMQFMFVIAFLVNALTIFWIARKWQTNQIKLWMIFLIFWFVDALVPWLYQTFIFGASSIPTVIMLGFFPAVIIAISTRVNYRKFEMTAET